MKIINQSPLKTQQGFTLIELVVVIVILGILAATAAPKFIDLTGDAKASTIKAVRGSVESATTMVHAKVLVKGATAATTVDIDDSTTIAIVNGWPSATTEVWDEVLDLSSDDFISIDDAGKIVWYPTQDTPHADIDDAEDAKCFVSYTDSTSSDTRPVITVDTDDC
ncbi:type II secretion system protein [Pseudocolwellia sp. HL-MZ7]|uniref:type II secretion system protein n=1 Tax=Pseudocolwellia sp. HL-MZ7 TaxID=3400627 RepID=UPI003CE9C014